MEPSAAEGGAGAVAASAASCWGFTASNSASARQAAAASVPTARPGWAAASRWAEASLATTACTRSLGSRPLAISGNSKAWAMRPRPITPKVPGEKLLKRGGPPLAQPTLAPKSCRPQAGLGAASCSWEVSRDTIVGEEASSLLAVVTVTQLGANRKMLSPTRSW